MKAEPENTTAVGLFASACEQLNDYARSLRASARFSEIRTGSDIRGYHSGWCLEKWVEAELDRTKGFWAGWWLELQPHEKGWTVESSLNISHSEAYVTLCDKNVESLQELEATLAKTVNELTLALEQNPTFRDAVKACHK